MPLPPRPRTPPPRQSSSRRAWYLDAAASEHEVTLTTVGRKSGKPRQVTIWITTDGERLYVRSGAGMGRDWPQNLMARGEATLRLGGRDLKVKPRRVTDETEARATSQLARKKYGIYVKPSKPGEPLTTGETAVFQLLPQQ
jgi:deazaflavin-dependent oxidoreductase (nitroreductase family)